MRSGTQAVVRPVIHEGRACVLKSPRGGVWKPISRRFLWREWKVYQRLKGVQGIAESLGYSEEGWLLEAVEGRPLSEFRRGQVTVGFLDELDRVIFDIHSRGVVHSDLKKRANILVAGDRPVILDFGAAFLEGEWLYETFRRVDLAAAAKLRAHHQPETLRADQKTLLENPTWAERLSRFLIRTVRDPYRAMVGDR